MVMVGGHVVTSVLLGSQLEVKVRAQGLAGLSGTQPRRCQAKQFLVFLAAAGM